MSRAIRFQYMMLFSAAAALFLFGLYNPFLTGIYAEEYLAKNDAGEVSKDIIEEDESEGAPLNWEVSGFIRADSMLSTYKDQELKEANKKNEIRDNLKIGVNGENLSFMMNMNAYVNANIINDTYNEDYVYAEEFETDRNLTLSDKGYEASFPELYLGYSVESFRIRAGNQLYAWGAADVFNPTSYFNAMDSRELFFRDEDNLRLGVPSVSGMVFIGDYTLEMVFVPVHIPMAMAPRDNYWAINYWMGPFPVHVQEPEGMDVKPENFGYGARIASNILGADVSLSCYHGPDIEPAMKVMGTEIIPNKPVALFVIPEYDIVNYAGLGISRESGKFVFQFEIAYSPDKAGTVSQGDTDDIEDPDQLIFPFEIEKTHYISYSAGLNYFIPLEKLIEGHDGECVLTLEWHQAMFPKGEINLSRDSGKPFIKAEENDRMMPPIMTDIITGMLMDSYFSNQLKVMVMGMYETKNSVILCMPRIGWDFQNGFTCNISYGFIDTLKDNEDDITLSLFGYYNDHDVILVEARYEY